MDKTSSRGRCNDCVAAMAPTITKRRRFQLTPSSTSSSSSFMNLMSSFPPKSTTTTTTTTTTSSRRRRQERSFSSRSCSYYSQDQGNSRHNRKGYTQQKRRPQRRPTSRHDKNRGSFFLTDGRQTSFGLAVLMTALIIVNDVAIVLGLSLGGGIFNTSSPPDKVDNDSTSGSTIQQLLDLSFDLSLIQQRHEDAANIYKFGRAYNSSSNSNTDDSMESSPGTTLASLSVNWTSGMKEDPIFNLYKYYHLQQHRRYDDDDDGNVFVAELYAHEHIMNVLEDHQKAQSQSSSESSMPSSTQTIEVVAHSILVHSVWMAAVHELTNVWRICHDEFDPAKSLEALDHAAALWIGAETEHNNGDGDAQSSSTSTNTTISSLYQLARDVDTKFRRSSDNSTSMSSSNWVNYNLLENFNRLQSLLLAAAAADNDDGYNDLCSQNSSSTDSLRPDVYRAINVMTVPLIQKWIVINSESQNENVDMLDIYSIALAPLLMACDPTLVFQKHEDSIASSVLSQQQLESSLSCLRLTHDDIGVYIGEDASASSSPSSYTQNSLVGYIVSDMDAMGMSRIDRDVFQLDIFLNFGSYQAAMDWYHYGYNSDVSLRDLALGSYLPTTPTSQFGLFQSYYAGYDLADIEITKALSFEAEFQNVTNDERNAVVLGLIRYQVMYMSAASWLQSSIEQCNNGSLDTAMKFWDFGAVLYIGSMEGYDLLGTPHGQLLFSSSRALCASFDTCEPSSTDNTTAAIVNRIVISALKIGKAAISISSCRQVETLLEGSIIPEMQVPLIQGTILSAAILYNETISSDLEKKRARGTAHAASRSVLPLINETWPSSADSIDRLLRFGAADITIDPFDEVLDAFRSSFPDLKVRCIDIGTILDTGKDVCPIRNDQPPSLPPSSLQEAGSFIDAEIAIESFDISSIDCSEIGNSFDKDTSLCGALVSSILPDSSRPYASLGLDVSQMKIALRSGNISLAKQIYRDGKNLFVEGIGFISLESLSVVDTNVMRGDPVFNFFRKYYDGRKNYADDYVQQIFSNENRFTLAAEASVILNVWMYIVHLLTSAVGMCTQLDFNASNGIDRVDMALAYWIGDAKLGMFGGNLMYGVAEEMKRMFLVVGVEMTDANEMILANAHEIKTLFHQAGTSCIGTTYTQLLRLVQNTIRYMTLPLIQGWIHSLKVNDTNRAMLYSKSALPVLGVCDPRDFTLLKERFNRTLGVDDIDNILDSIYRSLGCLGLSCELIGTHHTDIAIGNRPSQCDTVRKSLDHAGYSPGQMFNQYAPLDLDLRELGLLTGVGATKAASDLFMHGKHTNISLAYLALSPDLDRVPHFPAYAQYFGSSVYAYDILTAILESDNVLDLNRPSDPQRVALALRFGQAMIFQHGALEAIYVTLSSCRGHISHFEAETNESGESDAAINTIMWDQAAAFLLGSVSRMEDPEHNLHHDEWYSPFDLAQRQCVYFETCEPGQIAPINKHMIELLYAGRGASSMLSCEGIRKTGDEMQALLLVPVIQAALSGYAELMTNPDDYEVKMAELYVFVEVLMPLLVEIDRKSAENLKNLFFNSDEVQSPHHRFAVIFGALADFFDELGVDCNDIGKMNNIHACQASSISIDTTKGDSGGLPTAGMVLIILFLVIPCTFLVVHLLASHRRCYEQKTKQNYSVKDLEDTQNEPLNDSFLSSINNIEALEFGEIGHFEEDPEEETVPLRGLKAFSVFNRMKISSIRSSEQSVVSEKSHTSLSELSTVSRDLAKKSYSNRCMKRSLSFEASQITSSVDKFHDDVPLPFVVEEDSSAGGSSSTKDKADVRKDQDDEDVMKIIQSSKTVEEVLNKNKELFDPAIAPNPSGTHFKKNVSFAPPFGVDIDDATDNDDYVYHDNDDD